MKNMINMMTMSDKFIICIIYEKLKFLMQSPKKIDSKKINIAKFNENAVNLNTIMGKREIDDDIYKNLGQKFIDNGATILGGCCETSPKHTKILSNLR